VISLFKKRGVILANYKAKKSNLKTLLLKSNTKLDVLAANTGIPASQLNEYFSKKVMSLNNAMTISKELNCQIEDLYVWNVNEGD
jgi:DNA-binding Xre family transcriptional regulator